MTVRPFTKSFSRKMQRAFLLDAFDLQDLFSNGEQGALYTPWDLSTMYQDSAGTTPAAIDSPVGLIKDQSGNGNHASQSTDAARPILRETAGGLRYLEFDGVDDSFSTPNDIIADQTAWSASMSGDFATSKSAGWLSINGSVGGADSIILTSELGIRTGGGFKTWGEPPSGVFVYTTVHPGSGSISDTQAYLDGIESSQSGLNDAVLDLGGSTVTYIMRDEGGSNRTGRIYAALFIDRHITTSERQSVESEFAKRAGVTL